MILREISEGILPKSGVYILRVEYEWTGFQTRMVSQLMYQRDNILSKAQPFV